MTFNISDADKETLLNTQAPVAVKALLGTAKGNIETLSGYLAVCSKDGKTPLLVAVTLNRVDVVGVILDAVKGDIALLQSVINTESLAMDSWAHTALTLAAKRGHTEIVRAILDITINNTNFLQNIQEEAKETCYISITAACRHAIQNQHLETTKILLAACKNVSHELKVSIYGDVFALAAKYGYIELMQTILNEVKDTPAFLKVVNAKLNDIEQGTALELAAKAARPEAMKIIFEAVKGAPAFSKVVNAVVLDSFPLFVDVSKYRYMLALYTLAHEVEVNKEKIGEEATEEIQAILTTVAEIPMNFNAPLEPVKKGMQSVALASTDDEKLAMAAMNIVAIKKHSTLFNNQIGQLKNKLPSSDYSWKILLCNLLIAATGIGLLVIAGHYAMNGTLLFAPAGRRLAMQTKALEETKVNLYPDAFAPVSAFTAG